MISGLFYILLALAIISFLLVAYNIYCYIGIKIFNYRVSKDGVDATSKSGSKVNIWLTIIKKACSGNFMPSAFKKLAFKTISAKICRVLVVVTLVEVILSTISSITSLSVYEMDILLATVASTQLGDKECSCYAKCTGNKEDDKKTAYELLFGEKNYLLLIDSMGLEAQVEERLMDIHKNSPSGREESDIILQYLDISAVNCYKQIVGSNKQFRSADGKDRSAMTDDELLVDLKALFNDYKSDGRNKHCKCCKKLNAKDLQSKCMGEPHYVEGWTWEKIWIQDDITPGSNSSSGYASGAENSPYGLQLNGKWYYWYQQYDCNCPHDPVNDQYGKYSRLYLYSPNSTDSKNTAAARGCSTYSTAAAISNAIGIEVTPWDVVLTILEGGLQNYKGGYRLSTSRTDLLNLAQAPPAMNKPALAKRAEEIYSQYDLHADYSSFSQSFVDDILSKQGFIVASYANGPAGWYNGEGHFIVIREKVGDLYYSIDSNGTDTTAMQRMSIGVTWNALANANKNGDCIGYWREGGPIQPSTGGGSPQSGDMTGNSNVEAILRNEGYSTSKAIGMSYAYEQARKQGWSKQFAVGLMANIAAEGSPGQFEGNWGSSYWNKCTQAVKNLALHNLCVDSTSGYAHASSAAEARSWAETWLNGTDPNTSGPGVGSIQWSEPSRRRGILELYLKRASTWTEAEIVAIETEYMVYEINNRSLNTNATDAGDAAKDVCLHYEIPNHASTEAVKRASTAARLWNLLSAVDY